MNLERHLRRHGDCDRQDDGTFSNNVVLISHYAPRPQAEDTAEDTAASEAELDIWVRGVRYSERPMDWRTRLAGMGGTTAVAALVLACALFTWRAVQPMIAPSEPVVVTLKSFEAPPEPVQEVPEGPRQIEQQEQKPREEERPLPPEIVIPREAQVATPVPPRVEPIETRETVAETTAPKSISAPTGIRVSSVTQATWEAQLLAHLERFRRYPARARAARQEGIAYVRFRMNRAGTVLSASLIRSSGVSVLDQAALDTLRRAQPLPVIPDDRPDEVELTLPVEFFVRR